MTDENRPLRRSRDSVIAGVCGGLAERLGAEEHPSDEHDEQHVDVAEHRGVLYGIWPASYAEGMVAGINAAGGVPIQGGEMDSYAIELWTRADAHTRPRARGR